MKRMDWPYPGARWWKFDFHTHSPASADSYWARNSIDLSPEAWLLKFMAEGIDCVAVTDHNSGEWVDRLKSAYSTMGERPPDGFRRLTLFPGVELSVNGGFHLLAILDPSAAASDIDELLGAVGYDGTKGDSNGVTRKSAAEVVDIIIGAGGIPVPAHADSDSGMLCLGEDNRLRLDAKTVRQVLNAGHISAVEWRDRRKPMPGSAQPMAFELTRVLGSDCHSFRGESAPGKSYSWIKMAEPNLQGLRLALLDGNGVSVWRSDDEKAAPPTLPDHFLTSIKVKAAQFMGNGQAEVIKLTPFCNAFIGGRGTGKSTVVHALRLSLQRDSDLSKLGKDSEANRQFDQFRKVPANRDDDGGLREDSEILVELIRFGEVYRIRWQQDTRDRIVERRRADGAWELSGAVSEERFPIRLLSQGQIAEMAGRGRIALLGLIDEAAGIAELKRALEDEENSYRALAGKLREIDRKLSRRADVELRCEDLDRKIEVLESSDHAQVLQAHQRALRQVGEVDRAIRELGAMSGNIRSVAEDLLLDDWPAGVFDAARDGDAIQWYADAKAAVAKAREALEESADVLSSGARALVDDGRLHAWRSRSVRVRMAYSALQSTLSEQGIGSPQEFTHLLQRRQRAATELEQLNRLRQERRKAEINCRLQEKRLLSARREITRARSQFLSAILASNAFVRMEVSPYANDIEDSLRDLIEVHDSRFREDILSLIPSDHPPAGCSVEQQLEMREAQLQEIRQRLLDVDAGFGGHFRNYLDRKRRRPEFADYVHCWFPEDDLRVEYSRQGDGEAWKDILQGSQGQRSAALLSFLLAFGDEPIVLDQPEDDLDNHLIYDLIVQQILENKRKRQLIIVTHNANVVVNGDAELVHAFDFHKGQCRVVQSGALQDRTVREEVCQIMEGGRRAFERRWARLGRDV